MIPPDSSLVRYDKPVSQSKSTPSKSKKAAPGPGGKLPPVEATKAQQSVLNAILPPKEWNESGTTYSQSVSSAAATRLDVIELQERLDTKLGQRQARETGICPVRRELYEQAFDELIRQVTINCQERGLLLLRVRDEIKMTMAAYQTLYESSVSFGMRKALQAEQGKVDLEKRIVELESDKKDLESQVSSLRSKCDEIEKKGQEVRDAEKRKHEESFAFMKRTNEQLKSQLESILAPAKK